MSYLVSVVVPTYKRPGPLSRCLAALISQEFDPSAYEIIIVDDGADAGTREIVEAWAQKSVAYSLEPEPRLSYASSSGSEFYRDAESALTGSMVRVTGIPIVRYIAMVDEHGPAAARNAGWRAAAGEIIAFTDDDCIPSPGWLKAGTGVFDLDTMGIAGKVVMPIPLVPTDYERDAAGLERSEFVTANSFYRRSALEAVGGFDTRFRIAWREDSDLYFSMLESGCLLRRCPEAIVVHPIRPARFGISLSQQKKNMYNALLFKKHPRLYRQKIRAIPPVRYTVIVLSLLAGTVGFAAGYRTVTAAAALTWTLLTASFWLSRLKGVSHAPMHVLEMGITSAAIPVLAMFWRIRGAIRYKVFYW